MVKRFRLVKLCLVAVFAVTAIGVLAGPAMAFSDFEGDGTEITSSGGQQVFVVTGGEVRCKKVTGTAAGFTGTKTELTTKTIKYEECEAVGIGSATVTCSGYTFHIAGTTDVIGSGCVVKALTCEIKVGAQTGLKTVTYADLTGFEMETKASVGGITYTLAGFCPGITAGSGGKYTGSFISKHVKAI